MINYSFWEKELNSLRSLRSKVRSGVSKHLIDGEEVTFIVPYDDRLERLISYAKYRRNAAINERLRRHLNAAATASKLGVVS